MGMNRLYDLAAIKKILPHRSPFLFVDKVLKIESGDQITAEKELLPDEWFFPGHFPGRPIMPGVLVTEALAQTCGVLLGLIRDESKPGEDQKKPVFFLASANVKFSSPAKPGEILRLTANLKKKYGGLFLFDVAADVERRRIASGTLALGEEKNIGLQDDHDV